MSTCKHDDLQAQVNAAAMSVAKDGPPVVYLSEVRVRCRTCGSWMEFQGDLPGPTPGVPAGPYIENHDRTTLYLPMRPGIHTKRWDEKRVFRA